MKIISITFLVRVIKYTINVIKFNNENKSNSLHPLEILNSLHYENLNLTFPSSIV